jgi:hypothetical protein
VAAAATMVHPLFAATEIQTIDPATGATFSSEDKECVG